MSTLTERLAEIQVKLKAPKSQFNSFGKYSYRNQEDILEAVKPLLGGLVLTVADEMVVVGERIYVKATAKITDGTDVVEVSAFAREGENKKGMDDAQLTGATSSYARKYALNGLFLIDDTRDADATNDHGKGDKGEKKETKSPVKAKSSGNSFSKKKVQKVEEEEEDL